MRDKKKKAEYDRARRLLLRDKIRSEKHEQYMKNPDAVKRRAKEWRDKHLEHCKEKARRNYFLRKYGMSQDELRSFMDSRENRCEICGHAPQDDARWSQLVVDHDHNSGCVRGVLLTSAISYLGKGALC